MRNISQKNISEATSLPISSPNYIPKVIWLYGLSGSGKTTLVNALSEELIQKEIPVYKLDGDELRLGLNSDLKFSEEDRKENLRRSAELAKLFSNAGFVVLCSFITPLAENRKLIKEILGDKGFLVYVDCDLEICEKRDVKGLYKKARNGEIENFTGISAPFEIADDADFVVDTNNNELNTCKEQLLSEIYRNLDFQF